MAQLVSNAVPARAAIANLCGGPHFHTNRISQLLLHSPRGVRCCELGPMNDHSSSTWSSCVSVGGLASLGCAGLLWYLSREEAAKAQQLRDVQCHENLDGEATTGAVVTGPAPRERVFMQARSCLQPQTLLVCGAMQRGLHAWLAWVKCGSSTPTHRLPNSSSARPHSPVPPTLHSSELRRLKGGLPQLVALRGRVNSAHPRKCELSDKQAAYHEVGVPGDNRQAADSRPKGCWFY